MTTDDIRREEQDGIIVLTFTRDAKRNAVTPEMLETIATAVRDLGDDDAYRVLVITGEGRYFTAGLDIGTLITNVGEGTDGIVRGSNMRRQYRAYAFHDLFDEMEMVEKPIVIAAQSHCLGVGVEMAVSCDFRLAAEGTTFGLPEVANIATIPGSGGISRLTRLVGPHWARWIAMACRTVSAEQARDIGLVHDIYPADGFHDKVLDFAKELAAMPREALGLAKVAIDAAASVDRRTAREIDRLAQTTLFMSDEYRDRVNAFNAASAARQAKPPPEGRE
jgi:enoyl-CoA hydratase